MPILPIRTMSTLALAAIALAPIPAGAQSTRTAAPAPAPATAAPAPATPAPQPAAPTSRRATGEQASSAPWTDQEYVLGTGDKLRIEVFGQPQLSQSLQIRPDGKITLPLTGDVQAAGLAPSALADALTEALRAYVTNPVVTVIVQEAVAPQVHVIGEVAKPGPQVLQGPLTMLQVLSQAGGLLEFADKDDIVILRRGPGGAQERIRFDYNDAVNGRIPPVYVEPGDTVVVP